jgi:hypothetical protein
MASTALLPTGRRPVPTATVVAIEAVAAMVDQIATWVKVRRSSSRKYGNTNGAARNTTNVQ